MLGVSQEYFANDFSQDLAEKLKDVPEENLVSPRPSIAAPAVEGLTYSLDEPDLKDLYLSLLKTASDGRVSTNAHPSFVRVIREMTSEEARLLSELFKTYNDVLPIVTIKLKTGRQEGGAIIMSRHVLDIDNENGLPMMVQHLATYVDNWTRLGLVDISYSSFLTRENAYEWVETRPEYISVISKSSLLRTGRKRVPQRSTIRGTCVCPISASFLPRQYLWVHKMRLMPPIRRNSPRTTH